MNAIIERSRFASLYEPDMSPAARMADAINGSRMLKEAILRAKGYATEEAIIPVADPVPPKVPKFRERKARLGRPKGSRAGWRKPRVHSPKVEQIKALIAAHFNMSLEDLEGRSRKFEKSHPRQVAMYLSRMSTSLSFPDIGWQFGGLDHTTILHAVRQVGQRVTDNDEKTIEAIRAVHRVIGA
jgi:hypothetical protein